MTETPRPVPVLTIDGPSGSGKGTIARAVAERLGWRLLDSGALYRAVGYAAGMAGLDLSDPEAMARCAETTRIRFQPAADGGDTRVIVNRRGRGFGDCGDAGGAQGAGGQAAGVPQAAWPGGGRPRHGHGDFLRRPLQGVSDRQRRRKGEKTL